MIDSRKIEQLARQITDSLPPGVRNMADNVEERVRLAVQQQLGRLDVVTRDELEVQQQLILRMRSRIEALEERLNELEGSAESDQ